MKTRMEKYHSGDITPQRVEKNTYLYDEIYSEKKEPTSNVTVLDNVNEIDINKIKSIINNREEYKKVKTYSNLIGREEKYCKEDLEFNFDEREPKDYDINEILKRKRSDKDSVIESEKIRKISNTQYDILKGLDLKHIDDDDEMDTEFFTQEKELKSLISTITEKKEEEKTTTDFFKDLKGKDDEDLTPPKAIEENNINSIEDKDNTSFYSSKYSFAKDDFEDLEDLKKEVKKHNVTMKVLLVLIICIVIVAIVLLAINYIDFNSLLK